MLVQDLLVLVVWPLYFLSCERSDPTPTSWECKQKSAARWEKTSGHAPASVVGYVHIPELAIARWSFVAALVPKPYPTGIVVDKPSA
jgi:hypothetical protein